MKKIVAGLDVGSRSTNAVLLEDMKILSSVVITTGVQSFQSAETALGQALHLAGRKRAEISFLAATGYGRVVIPYADKIVTEITCHARGAHWLFPSVRTVLDIGGQDCKAIRCDCQGNVVDFIMNDKCAAGTGRFLEIMAQTLGFSLEEIGLLSLAATSPEKINATCTVFARSEVIGLLRQGKEKNDILAGVHDAVVKRVLGLLKRVGVEKELVMTGGGAKNTGLVQRFEDKLGLKILLPPDSQIVGALGAALLAREMATGDL